MAQGTDTGHRSQGANAAILERDDKRKGWSRKRGNIAEK
jgi:hypothetical protein